MTSTWPVARRPSDHAAAVTGQDRSRVERFTKAAASAPERRARWRSQWRTVTAPSAVGSTRSMAAVRRAARRS